jgi:hypothetical protein
MEKRERLIYVPMLFIGVLFVTESLQLGLGSLHRPGKGFLPFFASAGLTLVSLICFVRTTLATRAAAGKLKGRTGQGSVFKVILIVAALFIYVFILPWLGYLVDTFLLLLFLFAAAGFRRKVTILTYAFASTFLSYVIFSSWLNLRFPKGFLGF